mmetsp:Transcript_2777/g.5794  ORF Transcript_2777/g.5794 Transcript_2777/m.5794 type:complete len:237 (+) Transcript_2777:2271-2981(+)
MTCAGTLWPLMLFMAGPSTSPSSSTLRCTSRRSRSERTGEWEQLSLSRLTITAPTPGRSSGAARLTPRSNRCTRTPSSTTFSSPTPSARRSSRPTSSKSRWTPSPSTTGTNTTTSSFPARRIGPPESLRPARCGMKARRPHALITSSSPRLIAAGKFPGLLPSLFTMSTPAPTPVSPTASKPSPWLPTPLAPSPRSLPVISRLLTPPPPLTRPSPTPSTPGLTTVPLAFSRSIGGA